MVDQLLVLSFMARRRRRVSRTASPRSALEAGLGANVALNLAAFLGFHLDRADRAEPYLDELAAVVGRCRAAPIGRVARAAAGDLALRQGGLERSRRVLQVANDSAWELGDPMLEAWTTAYLADACLPTATRLVRRGADPP